MCIRDRTGDLLELRGYTFEITEVRANAVKTARIRTPQMNHRADTPERTRR